MKLTTAAGRDTCCLFFCTFLLHISKIICTFAPDFKTPLIMKHNLFLLIAAAIMAACSTPDLPTPDKNAKADFTYYCVDAEYHPLSITFNNASTAGLSVWLWEMGDGKTYASGDRITHTYSKAGIYSVTLVCKDKNGYSYETTKSVTVGNGSSGGGTGTKECYAMFSHERTTPLMVEFVNMSQNCVSYLWEFGDGMYSTGKDAIHEYASIGTYTVTLTAKGADGNSYTTKSNITLTQPTAYVDGFTIYAIPYENKCYRLVFKDDALLPSSWDWNTIYFPISNEDIPFSYTMNTKKEFANPMQHDYWTITLMRANSFNGDGETSCLKCKLSLSDLMQCKPEYIWRSESGNTAFGIKMGYAY